MGLTLQTEGGALTNASLACLGNILGLNLQLLAASGAISPHLNANYMITKSSALAALTLAAPTAGVDDGTLITVTSSTAEAHTITATSLLETGGSGVPYTTATFAAHAGASVTLMAYNGFWFVLFAQNVTFS